MVRVCVLKMLGHILLNVYCEGANHWQIFSMLASLDEDKEFNLLRN